MTLPVALVAVLAALLATAAVGFSVVRLFARNLTRAELAAWSFATGLLVQSVLFALCLRVFRGPVRAPLLALDAILVAASFLVRRERVSAYVPESPRRSSAGPVARLLLAAAGPAWLAFLIAAISEPMWSTDFLAIWGLKARTIFETSSLPARLFDDPALAWSHPEYPLLVPLSLAATATLAGGWHDQALALFYPVCALATLMALHGFLSRRSSPRQKQNAAVATALAAACFPLYRAVNVGTAEVPLAFALVLLSCAFLDALDRPRDVAANASIAAIALFCVSVKQEGTLFVLLLAVAFAVRRRSFPWALVAPALVHGAVLRMLRGPQRSRDFDLTLLAPGRWPELAGRVGRALSRIVETVPAAGWAALVAIALFLVLMRRGAADPLMPVLLVQVAAYVGVCAVSAFDPAYAVDAAFARIATTLFPALALVLAPRLPSETAP